MESGALGMDTSTATDPGVQSDCSIACLRRRAWAQSRDWQETEPEHCGPQGPQQSQTDSAGDAQRPSEEPGRVPNKITSWLIECRTPFGASLDDQSASPSRGALRNGCSFEDDLSLGAEANHLQSSNKKTESCFGLAADQKRSQYKERGRSMNSTGSGKSSTVSSVSEVLEQSEEHQEEILLTLRVSELLDLYEEDPEEILLNLGFGREEPDLASKVPSRFFNNSSTARGIDIKVYLGAQMQRMELENPNYALTSRFRQIEVLTTVANEFFQLYSQVSGQPVQRISSRDQGGEKGEGVKDEPHSSLKRSSSALNTAKLFKKTLSKHNLLMATPESPEAHTLHRETQLNGHTHSDHTLINGHTHSGPEQDTGSSDPDHQKHIRKKESCSLATVTEETNGDGETDRLTDNSPEQSSTGTAANGAQQTQSADLQSTNQRTEKGTQAIREEEEEEKEEEEKNLTSTPEKAPLTLVPPKLAQLRTENADSFDMEEIQSNEDEALPPRNSRNTDLLRTVSQQSDSSGFAEEPSADSSYLKVQESSDSCDSETTVTSHPSQDVATPLALDQPAFDLPDSREEEAEPSGTADGSSSREEDEHNGSSEQVPEYTAHQLPRNRPMGAQQDERLVETGDQTDPKLEPEPELELTQSLSASEQEPEHSQNQTETAADTEAPTEGVGAEDKAQVEHVRLGGSHCPPTPSSLVLSALNRAKKNQLGWEEQQVNPQPSEMPQRPGRGRGRGATPLQRSSSLPSSLLLPARVVSSVRIQFGRGQASCTQPRYSFRYTQEARGDTEEEEEGVEEVEGQTNYCSTRVINHASSSGSDDKPPRLPTVAPTPPTPIPRYLMRSSHSLHSPSPPPDWSPGGQALSWSTQSVPDLSPSQQQLGQFQQSMSSNQNQQSWNPGQMMFPYPTPSPNPTAQYLNPSPNLSPSLNPNPYPFTLNPPPQYPSSLHPYASLPNLLPHHNPSLNHHSSLTSLHQPTTPPIPQHGSLSNLYQPSATAPHHISLGNLQPGTPIMHHQGYNYPYSHQLPYHATPHSLQFATPYLGYHGYNVNPHLAFPHPVTQLAPEHSLNRGNTPPAPGFLSGPASALGPGHSLHPGLTPPAAPGHSPSSTEMQLRRVLHDIRGTVQSLSQNRADTPDVFSEHRAPLPSHQSLAEFQQKRRSLNLFRSQMMDLELSIIRQQALVYKHLSPADRLEMEQLQSLRSAVREELQELEQQLEDRLMEHTPHRGLHRDSSIDSLSTASALRAMEPVSDLLREQLFLQSELSYDGHASSTNPSSRSSSPVRGGGGCEQRQGVYRASINITPVTPPRPNTHTEEEEEEEGGRDGGGGGGGGGEVPEVPEEDRAAGGVRVENLQQLIREIRESVAQEVRREIYSELMSAVSPLPARQQPL